jgi:integral membrane protein
MLKAFRIISLIEGVSYLLILCVTLGVIGREYVYFLGMAHGVLFILYFVFSLLASHKQAWSLIVWLLVLIASVIPFAFIAVEMFVKRASGKIQQVA